ncbi:hypothetical protein BB560_006199, partial [Smittium megazygosporum]
YKGVCPNLLSNEVDTLLNQIPVVRDLIPGIEICEISNILDNVYHLLETASAITDKNGWKSLFENRFIEELKNIYDELRSINIDTKNEENDASSNNMEDSLNPNPVSPEDLLVLSKQAKYDSFSNHPSLENETDRNDDFHKFNEQLKSFLMLLDSFIIKTEEYR